MEEAKRGLAELEELVEEQRAILQELEETLAERRAAVRRVGRGQMEAATVPMRTARLARGRMRRAARAAKPGGESLWIAPPASGVTEGVVADLMDARSVQWRRAEEAANALRDGQPGAARRLLEEIVDTETGIQATASSFTVRPAWAGLAADLLAASDDVIRAARGSVQAIDQGNVENVGLGAVITGQTAWLRAWRVLAQVLPQS